ncbi:hypothetical protein G9A89_007246 [Geosiphon pyriformis]|nr:hypothetical protein G9A89_007246 [Geosiphon pyriformis]
MKTKYFFEIRNFFFTAVFISFQVLFSNAGLQVDLISISGLKYFKENNLTDPGIAEAALRSLKAKANSALVNKGSYTVTTGRGMQIPPNGNKHEYYSWAPYLHADCSKIRRVKNPMIDCPYKRIDGLFASDLKLLADPKESGNMITDVLALTIYYFLYDDEEYAKKAVDLLNIWFLDKNTGMTPRVEYGQVIRGPGFPDSWVGRVEGILDLRFYVFIPGCVEILGRSKSGGKKFLYDMKIWFRQYADWLIQSKFGTGARNAGNNHATFYIVQLATYLAWTGQDAKASRLITSYMNRQFQEQISSSGEQELESGRTRPFHYQYFNLIALTYIARLSVKIPGTPNLWEAKTKEGATIKTAIDFLVKKGLPKNENSIYFLVPLYAAKQYYGDNDGKYSKILAKILENDSGVDEWWMLWNPLALVDSGPLPKKKITNFKPEQPNNGTDNIPTEDGDINDEINEPEDGGGYTPSLTNDTIEWSSALQYQPNGMTIIYTIIFWTLTWIHLSE